MMFSKVLIEWYLQHKRALPWRTTKDPYKIWLSEIILQQTRVDQGLDYYQQFVKTYPQINNLANASQDHVLKLWQGLGYYSRARNLHSAAQYIVNDLNGQFPSTYQDLLKLKGVGDYTASAIASICYNEPTAVVDGNVYRVLSRYFGNFTPINSTQGIKEFKNIAQKLLDVKDPGTYNQAVMEYGARVCKPQNPLCVDCGLQSKCAAFKDQTIKELPVKIKKIKIKKRFLNFLVITTKDDKTILEQRKGKGIWQNLYQFPLVESDALISKQQLFENNSVKKYIFEEKDCTLFNEKPVIHKLSHQHLYVRFWFLKTEQQDANFIPWKEITNYAVPVLIDNFLKVYK